MISNRRERPLLLRKPRASVARPCLVRHSIKDRSPSYQQFRCAPSMGCRTPTLPYRCIAVAPRQRRVKGIEMPIGRPHGSPGPMPMPDLLRTWLRLGEIRVQVMPLLFSLGGRPVNKKTPRERPLSRWQRFRRAPDSPRYCNWLCGPVATCASSCCQ